MNTITQLINFRDSLYKFVDEFIDEATDSALYSAKPGTVVYEGIIRNIPYYIAMGGQTPSIWIELSAQYDKNYKTLESKHNSKITIEQEFSSAHSGDFYLKEKFEYHPSFAEVQDHAKVLIYDILASRSIESGGSLC